MSPEDIELLLEESEEAREVSDQWLVSCTLFQSSLQFQRQFHYCLGYRLDFDKLLLRLFRSYSHVYAHISPPLCVSLLLTRNVCISMSIM